MDEFGRKFKRESRFLCLKWFHLRRLQLFQLFPSRFVETFLAAQTSLTSPAETESTQEHSNKSNSN